MKKLFLAISMVSLAAAAHAAPPPGLVSWVNKALTKCPESKVSVEEVTPPLAPTNFQVFAVTQTSSDTACGGTKYLLFSPTTQQILMGAVIPLPADARPAEARVNEVSSNLLKADVKSTIAPFPLPDGLKAVSITKQTEFGPFSYHGFIDQGQHFLIIADRQNLRDDPGKALLETLGVANGVHRGKAKSNIQIVELSDFQCPTCGRAHKTVEPLIEKALGKISYTRLDLPLFEHHPWAIWAALGGRAIEKVAPSKYWDYVNYVFANQETIDKQKFDDVIKNYAEDHDLNWKAIEKIYRDPAEKAKLLDQVSRAFDAGIISTPTYIINGQILGFGPKGEYTIENIKKAIAAAK
jgi:protein-disulfide isomerase